MAIKKVCWGVYGRYITTVHFYDSSREEVSGGWRKTLCGQKFYADDAIREGNDDNNTLETLRPCKRCKRIAPPQCGATVVAISAEQALSVVS